MRWIQKATPKKEFKDVRVVYSKDKLTFTFTSNALNRIFADTSYQNMIIGVQYDLTYMQIFFKPEKSSIGYAVNRHSNNSGCVTISQTRISECLGDLQPNFQDPLFDVDGYELKFKKAEMPEDEDLYYISIPHLPPIHT